MRRYGMKKRLLAAVLSVGMLGSLTAVPALADNATSDPMKPDTNGYKFSGVKDSSTSPDVSLSKTAKDNGDGTYTITLTANTEKVVKTAPTRVVFVLDASGSMNYCTTSDSDLSKLHWNLKELDHWHANDGTCNYVKDNKRESRWAIATSAIQSMSSDLEDKGVSCEYVYFKDEGRTKASESEAGYKGVTPKGGTYLSAGVRKAQEVLNRNKSDNEDQIMIVVADGDSDDRYPKNEAANFKKNGGTIYTVGFTFSDDNFKNLASEDCYKDATDADSLNIALNEITENINALITDDIGDNVTYIDGSLKVNGEVSDAAAYSADSNTIKWQNKEGLDGTVTLTYDVKIEDEDKQVGLNKLNGKATLNYQNDDTKKDVNAEFPVPEVKLDKLTVNYKAGDEIVKTDTFWTVVTGAETDAFDYTILDEFEVGGTTYYKTSDVVAIPKPNGEGSGKTATVKVSTEEPAVEYTVTINYVDEKGKTISEATETKAEAGTSVDLERKEVEGYTFSQWEPATLSIENDSFTMPEYNVTITARYTTNPVVPETPDKPGEDDLKGLSVTVACANKTEGHDSKYYAIDSYKVDAVEEKDGEFTCKVTLSGIAYAEKYNADVDGHAVTSAEDLTFTMTYKDGKWTAPAATSVGTILVSDVEKPDPTPEPDPDPEIKTYTLSYKTEGLNGEDAGLPADKELEAEEDVEIVTEAPAIDGYEFVKWEYAGITENDIVNGMLRMPTKNVTITAVYRAKTPVGPTKPGNIGWTTLAPIVDVSVECVATGSNATKHDAIDYELIEDSYTVKIDGKNATVTIDADKYIAQYSTDTNETHKLSGSSTKIVKLIWAATTDEWQLAGSDETTTVAFRAICENETPKDDKPDQLKKYEDIAKYFEGAFKAICKTDKSHMAESGLLEGSYKIDDVKKDEDGIYTVKVTVRPSKYVALLDEFGTTHTSSDANYVATLTWDAEDGEWIPYSKNGWGKTFTATCTSKDPDPTPAPDEKQYATITFKVVNGTFDENGLTEITKTFVVGTKLDTSMLPATTGNKGYSDPTWDKNVLSYTVEADGTTFVITYHKSNNGGTSDRKPTPANGGGTNGGSNVLRGSATNASGKTGHWILEGGEFTENNGRLPSNEYLKIGGSIYGFYTNGFAIDFDRPEYYTDAAIAAKGGCRDAQGTWRINGWWFEYDDGTYPHNEWVYLSWNGRSDWYYFDVDGWMEDGWFNWNDNWYYLHTEYDNTRGHMYTGWHEIDGKQYYFNTASDKGTLGAMLSDTTTPDGHKVGADGARID